MKLPIVVSGTATIPRLVRKPGINPKGLFASNFGVLPLPEVDGSVQFRVKFRILRTTMHWERIRPWKISVQVRADFGKINRRCGNIGRVGDSFDSFWPVLI